MKKIFQQIIDPGRGDCVRASVASILDLEIEQVPHFLLYGKKWQIFFTRFMGWFGYEFAGVCSPGGIWSPPRQENSVNDLFLASVDSKKYPGRTSHMVLINSQGVVVHDPTTTENSYCGENVLENGKCAYWYMFERKTDD